MKKNAIILLLVLISAIVLFALQSANYILTPQAASTGGLKAVSGNYSGVSTAGQASSGVMTSANHTNISGFVGALIGSGANTPPSIGNFKVDGEVIIDNDYVTSDGLLTATILDLESAVSQESSSISIDGSSTTFANLTSPSTYDASSGQLSVQLDLADGNHTIIIQAYDVNNDSSSLTRLVKVDAGGTKVANALVYPNPFDPSAGSARLGYQMNQDADVTLYLFNEINQLVWKRTYPSGSNGGKSGYNEILWNGVTDFGLTAANGAYFLRIVSGGKQIGRIRIAVLR
jgi:hypothetical protein